MRLDQTPGTVVILASETGRYTGFWVSMLSLGFSIPPGSQVKAILGSDIAESRNQALEDFDGDWIWFIDDDHTFDPTIVMQLLSRDVDIVTPLCLRRNQPFYPVAAGLDGNFLDIRACAPDGLVEVMHAGSSGMLIRRDVIETLKETLDGPLFELGHRESDGNRISEDVNFCRAARDAGFGIYVDCAARLAHTAVVQIWPSFSEEEDRWLTGMTVADGAEFFVEMPPQPELLDVTDVTGPEAVPVPEPG